MHLIFRHTKKNLFGVISRHGKEEEVSVQCGELLRGVKRAKRKLERPDENTLVQYYSTDHC